MLGTQAEPLKICPRGQVRHEPLNWQVVEGQEGQQVPLKAQGQPGQLEQMGVETKKQLYARQVKLVKVQKVNWELLVKVVLMQNWPQAMMNPVTPYTSIVLDWTLLTVVVRGLAAEKVLYSYVLPRVYWALTFQAMILTKTLKTLVSVVRVILRETPVLVAVTLRSCTSQGLQVSLQPVVVIQKPWRKARAPLGLAKLERQGSMTQTSLLSAHPARAVVSMLKLLASQLRSSSAKKLTAIKLHDVYFHCVRTRKVRTARESAFDERIEKNRSVDCAACSDLIAIATPGLFWNGVGRVQLQQRLSTPLWSETAPPTWTEMCPWWRVEQGGELGQAAVLWGCAREVAINSARTTRDVGIVLMCKSSMVFDIIFDFGRNLNFISTDWPLQAYNCNIHQLIYSDHQNCRPGLFIFPTHRQIQYSFDG